MGGYDYTDEAIINSQRATGHARVPVSGVLLWDLSSYPFSVGVGASIDVWASWTDPALNVVGAYVASGTPTVTVVPFYHSAKITLAGGASGATFSSLTLSGTSYVRVVLGSELVQDAASMALSWGEMQGNPIDTDFLGSNSAAKGIASYIVWRYGAPRSKPTLVVENRFPSILVRKLGDRITLTSRLLSETTVDYFIRSLSTTINNDGSIWQTTFQLEQAPTSLNLFTVGGTAAQGLGGSGVLGY
jgi:hypothetical protein